MGTSVFKHIKVFFHPYLLPLKALFFFQLGAQASIVPYIPLFLQHLGLKASESGILYGSLSFISLLSKPSTGALSDKLKSPFALIRVFSIVQLAFFLSMWFIPPLGLDLAAVTGTFDCRNYSNALSADHSVNVTCALKDLSTNVTQELFLNPDEFPHFVQDLPSSHSCYCETTGAAEAPVSDDETVRWTMQFWLAGLLLYIGWWAYAAISTLDDAVAFGIVAASPVSSTYGQNRALGTIGWALFALTVGLLMDQFSDSSAAVDRDFTPAFATFGVVAVLGFGATFFLPKGKPSESHEKRIASFRDLFTPEVLLFCCGAFVAGINAGLLYGYLAWYQSELGASNLLLGITAFVQACYEAPMMVISTWIIKKIGYHGCMLMGLLSFAVRFLGYGLIWNPWFVLLIDVVHSVGFGLLYTVLTNFAYDKAPPGGTATLQGLMLAIYEGFGQGIGGIAAGFLYQQFGGRDTWFGYCGFSFGASVLYALVAVFLRRPFKKSVSFLGEQGTSCGYDL